MAISQRILPAHVTRQSLVAAAPVLNIFRKRMVIGVGGGFGYICKERKKAEEWVGVDAWVGKRKVGLE